MLRAHMWADGAGAYQYCADVIMSRHRDAKPGYWSVMNLPDPSVCHWFGALDVRASTPVLLAVVDDFGTLVPVGVKQ